MSFARLFLNMMGKECYRQRLDKETVGAAYLLHIYFAVTETIFECEFNFTRFVYNKLL